MPQTNVTFPDGVTRPINHLEDTSESEILDFAEKLYIERFGLPTAREDFTFSTAPSPVLDPSTAIFSGSTGIPTQDIKTQEQRELERLAEEQSVGREFADIPIQVASGALSAGEMISEVFGADNFVARQIEKANEYTRDFLSAQSKLDSMEMQRIMEEAQDEGLLDQVLAGAKAFSVAPLDVSAQALGTAIPAITGGLAGAAARLTPRAITAVQGGIGALMGAGLVKGTIYDAIQSALLEAGVSEELAHRAASEAQEYTGPNALNIFAGTVLGALASTGPIERLAQTGIIQNVFSKIAANTGMVGVKEAGEAATQATVLGGMKNVIGAGLKESGYEFAQGAQEQIAENVALQQFGREYQEYAPVLQKLTQTPFARGVGTSGALEALGGFGVASGLATPFEIERYRRGDEAPASPPVDPLALEAEVSLEEEAEKRRKQEQNVQRAAKRTEAAKQQRQEEERTLPLQGSEAVDMLPPDQVNPLRVRLSDPKRESEIPIQNIDDLAEGIPTADIEGVLEDGSAKQDVVNKALDDVVKVIKQGHRLEYGPRQEAERSALEQVRGKEAADLYERTVKERMSYAESLRTKDTDQMAKNWAKRSAKQISRELRTHFPRDEEFKVIQGRGTLVIVDSSGKAYTEIDGSLDNAFDLAYSLASELGSESKTRSAEWKKTGQVYDPDETTVISGEDVAIKDVTGLPKQPKKKKYKNQKYTERQYRVASILARETGEMPIRADLENRTAPIEDKAFEALSKRIADESVQETETEPLRLEDKNKEIREKIRKVLSGFGLNDVGLVLTDRLAGYKYDTEGNVTIDITDKASKKIAAEDATEPLGGYADDINTIMLALDAVSATIKGEVTKKKLIKALENVLGHEIVHALRMNDLFTDQEWSLLSDLAVNRKKPNSEKTYMDLAAEQNPELAVELRADAMLEEAVANMIMDALNGTLKNFGGRPRSLVNRIYQFFLKLLNLKKDVGFETFEELITGIREGVVGSRERGVIRTKRQALRDQDETRAKTAKEFKEALKESEEAMTAAVTGEERDRAEDFDPDAEQAVERPAFSRKASSTIEDQLRSVEEEIYRLESEIRNDGPNYSVKQAARKAKELEDANTLRADLEGELSVAEMTEDSIYPDDTGRIYYSRGPQKPKKTRKAYKLFKVGKAKAGPNKGQPVLFPLYVAQRSMPNGLPIGEWMRAEMGESIIDPKTGKIRVKGKGIGKLAFRPGWHAALLPFARHIGNKILPDGSTGGPVSSRKVDQVWAEVEFGDDKDYSAELEKQGGEIRDRVPILGSYSFNTNKSAEGVWLIGGDMKINKILSDEEVEAINQEAGTADLPRLRPKNANVQKIQEIDAERRYEESLSNPMAFKRRLTGMPDSYSVDGQSVEFGFFEPALKAAEAHMAEMGLEYERLEDFAPLDPEMATKIAIEYELMPHAPDDPLVKAAYEALINETNAQFRKILDAGLTIRFIKGEDPYGNPRNAILDVVNNNNMFVFSTRDGFGSNEDVAESLKDNPLLQETEFVTADGEPMLANDVFRVVHDYFGHIKNGVGFRARGEENAWQSHAAMYSPLARRALTTETRGQNSWVNFGPYGEFNRTASPADTIYADQKIGLLPLWVSLQGRLSDERYKSDVTGERYTDGLQGAIGSDGLLELSHYSNNKVYRNQPELAGTGADRWANNRPKATWFGIVKADEDGFRIEKDKAVSSTNENIFKVDPKLLYRWYDPANPDAVNDQEGLIARWPAGNINYEDTFENLNNAGYIGFWANNKSGYGKYAVINTPLLSQDYTDKINFDTLKEVAEINGKIAFSRSPIKLTGFPDEFRGDRRRSFVAASGELDTLTREKEMQYDDEGNVIKYKQDDPSKPAKYLEGQPKLKKKGKKERLKALAKQKDFLELPYDEGLKRYMEIVKRARKQGFNTDIIFYHGTMASQPIRRFDPNRGDTREEEGMLTGREKEIKLGRQPAAHFTYSLDWAEDWALKELPFHRDKGYSQVYPVYLRLTDIFDPRNPEGLLSELNVNQAIEDAYNEIYERNNFNKEVFIKNMGSYQGRIEEIENTKVFQDFVKKIAGKSKVAQKIAFKETGNSNIMSLVEDLNPYGIIESKLASNWYRMYALKPFVRAVGISKYGSGFIDPRVEINKKTLPEPPRNPLNRQTESEGVTFTDLEILSPFIDSAGFNGYVDFEDTGNSPNGIAMFNSEDIKGIFADFDPEAVPEGMEYTEDIMFSRTKPMALASKDALEKNAAKNLEAAEKSQGRYIPRVNVDASLEAQYIANNPDSAATLDESERIYFSRKNVPKDTPESVTRAVNDLTGDPASPESPSEPFFRLLDMSSGEKLNYNVDKFRQSLIDKYARLARLYSRNPHLYKMLADTSAIDAAMLSEKATQFLAQTATKGVITYDLNGNGTTMVIPFERDGRKIDGLIGVLKGLYPDPRTNPHGNLEKVAQTYAILKRSERLKREGKKVPETETTLAEFERDIERYVDPTTGENIIRRWYADWTAFNEYTITFLQKTGVVDEEISQLWKDYSDFIPFYRQAQNEPDAINKDYKVYAQKIFGGMDNIPKLQELKGSEKEVTVPMFDAIYTNLAAAIQMGMKNVAAQRITRDMISLGLAQKKSEAEAGSGYTVKFKHKGKIQTYEILDPLVYESMKASDVGINAYYATLVGGPANFLREAITRMPPFWAANLFRDSLSSFVTAGANTTPIAGALYHFLNPMQGTTDLEMMGIVGGYGLDVDRGLGLGKQMEKLRKKQGIFLEGEDPSPWDLWKPIWDGLEVFTNRSEAAVRREVFNDTLKRTGNIAEAQKQAIEVLNFARRGNNPVLKYVTVATPFLNARIQGMDLVYRALSGKTMPADRRSRAMALVGTYTKAAILLGSTMLYYMMVRDDEQYEEQSEMDKNLFYFFPTESGRPIRMPIPFEIGLIFKTIPELIMRLMDGTVTPREAATNLGTQTLETFSITPPQIVKPLVEVYFNRDLYTGRPIEPYYMDRKMQEGFKQRPTTNEFAKFLSQDLGLSRVGYSPLDVEHLLSGYGGTLGVYGMAAIDSIMKSEAFIGDKTLIKPYEDWRDNAMARRFFGQRFPSGTLERYYQLQKDVDQIVGSINAAQTPEERERRAAGRKTMLQTVRKSGTPDPSLANIKESVKKFRDQIRFIGEQDVDAQEKAKRIDKVKKQRTDYLNTYLPLVIEKYGLDVPLFNDLYVEDEKLIEEDLERARVIGSGRGGIFKTKIDAMMNP